uniref:Uncharacterized protein n=1 Tax=Anguilla anguilla TaxID=7936 RepID=A0A0E9ST27_ANGAN
MIILSFPTFTPCNPLLF